MQDGFGLLEEKVKKAAELVKRLRRENKALEDDLGKSKARLLDAEQRLEALDKELARDAGKGAASEALAEELESLKQEREEVRKRIARLVEVLDGLE